MDNTVKKLEKRNLNEEQTKMLHSSKEMISFFKNKQAKGLPFSIEDEELLNSLEKFLIRMVKDSSVT
jgi:hypothetical protein